MMDVRPALVLFSALVVGCSQAAASLPPPHLVQTVRAADLAAGQDEV
jgi:hypothetical protein